VWYSDLFDRSIYQKWLADGARTFEQRLHEKTQAAMAHEAVPLPDGVLQELGRMAQHWE
jgi:trimethylamine:corrinoid methyltransferase-like protein